MNDTADLILIAAEILDTESADLVNIIVADCADKGSRAADSAAAVHQDVNAVAVAVAVQLPVERTVTAMPEADKVRRLSEWSEAERV